MSEQIPGAFRHDRDVRARQVLFVDGSVQSETNSLTIINIVNITVPGASMLANGQIHCRVGGEYDNNFGGVRAIALDVLFGGATMFSDAANIASSAAGPRAWFAWFDIFNLNSVSAQNMIGEYHMGNAAAATTGRGNIDVFSGDGISTLKGAAQAINTAVNQTLVIRVRQITTGAGVKIQSDYARVELFREA